MTANKSPRVPKYRRQKSRKRKVKDRAFVEIDGNRVYLGEYGTPESQQAYRRLIAEWLSGGPTMPTPEHDLTVTLLVARFWHHVESHYRKPDYAPTSEQASPSCAGNSRDFFFGVWEAGTSGPAVQPRRSTCGGSVSVRPDHVQIACSP